MIGQWTTQQVAEAIGAKLYGQDRVFIRVTTDSRTNCEDALFVALKGENFDAHDFVGQARGATALLVDHRISGDAGNLPQLVVKDTTLGLGSLGALNRCWFDGKVVAVTGSAGKTTVKELVASILGQQGNICKTQGNLNNHIGVPLSLLSLEESHQAAVFELGASGLNEIAYSVGLVKPDVAILNNAHAAHIEGFGSLANVVVAKGEIIRGLSAHGVAILNADDEHFSQWQEMAGNRRVISFGFTTSAEVSATSITETNGRTQFDLMTEIGKVAVRLPLPGEHNVRNALAASAAALALGIPLQQIARGLEQTESVPGRLDRKKGTNNTVVLDDTYNAGPGSMQEALKVLAGYSARKLAVLGHMAELGEHAGPEHHKVGSLARQLGIDELWVTGPWSANYQAGFGRETQVCADKQELLAELAGAVQEGDVILVKGSRSAGMEEIVNALCQTKENK